MFGHRSPVNLQVIAVSEDGLRCSPLIRAFVCKVLRRKDCRLASPREKRGWSQLHRLRCTVESNMVEEHLLQRGAVWTQTRDRLR